MIGRTFFFPDLHFKKLRREFHYIPRHHSYEENIRETVREALLGPRQFDLSPLFNPEGSVRQLVLSKGVLYLDLSSEALAREKDPSFFQKRIRALEKTLTTNFGKIQKFIITVDGQEVHSLYYGNKV